MNYAFLSIIGRKPPLSSVASHLHNSTTNSRDAEPQATTKPWREIGNTSSSNPIGEKVQPRVNTGIQMSPAKVVGTGSDDGSSGVEPEVVDGELLRKLARKKTIFMMMVDSTEFLDFGTNRCVHP